MGKEFRTAPMKDLDGFLALNEVKKLIDGAKRLRDRLLIRLLWATGARISEIVGNNHIVENGVQVFQGLKVKDIKWNDGVVILDTLKRRKREKGEFPPDRRRVPMDERTLSLLKKYVELKGLKETDKVFNISRQWAYWIVRNTGKRVGITKVGEKPLHPHHLRHSHCVAWVREDSSIEGLKRLKEKLGHAFISTTAYYLNFSQKKTKEITEKVFGQF